MIYLIKDTSNKFVLTLSETSTLSDPFYLFEFENEYNLGLDPIYWTALDESPATNRFNLFNLIDNSTTGSVTGGTGTTNLTAGQYTYKVYESTGQTLDVSLTTQQVLETGKMVVIYSQSYIDNNINNIYI